MDVDWDDGILPYGREELAKQDEAVVPYRRPEPPQPKLNSAPSVISASEWLSPAATLTTFSFVSPITRFVLRRSRAQLRQKVGAYGQVFGLAWWLMAAEHGADDVAVPPGWEQYVDALPEEFATALAYEDAELQALAGSAAEPLAHDLRDTFDEEYRVAERAWQRCAELALDEFDAW